MRVIPAIAAGALALGLTSAVTPVASARNSPAPTPPAVNGIRHFHLFNGSSVTLRPSGLGTITGLYGRNPRPFATVLPQGHSALRDRPGPSTAALIRQFSVPARSGDAGDVVVALTSGMFNGRPVKSGPGPHPVTAHSTDSRVNAALRKVGAVAAGALFGSTPRSRLAMLTNSARDKIGQRAVDLRKVYLVQVAGNPARAAQILGVTPGVSLAEPDQYVSSMSTNPVPLPSWVRSAALRNTARRSATSNAAGLPANAGFTSSLQSYLNANGVDLAGGYSDIRQRLHQLPGHGEIVTNVSLGDLTDESMADAGDQYVELFGPTTIVSHGQRYLDYPSLPLIPTYTASAAGGINPLGTVEHVDPNLSEVLLDFTMMAGLPHALQRPGATGSGVTDLLGIAPGASYRLVEPQQPTTANIAAAMLAAAQQTPRPDVINASLGFGTDVQGFPSRYLEDDPLMNSVVAAIVRQYGITVTISANDGTRLFTPASVGPDGGSAPTDVAAKHQRPTSVADDGQSTIPSVVPDSGAIDVGGTTLDDTIGVPPHDGSPLSRTGTFAETRLNGDTAFSSGFGSRVNVSAPSDNIAALMHQCLNPGNCKPTDAVGVLAGGTSAAAPMTAAVVADLLQVAKATGRTLTPAEVRSVLERTGRAVPTQPQIDQQLHVGRQIDMTAAVESLLKPGPRTTPAIVRLSIAHRVGIGDGGATFTELANPAAIDLKSEALVGPITVGIDATGIRHRASVSYALAVHGHVFTSQTPSIRLTPAELLAAAGLPLVSSSNRTIQFTAEIVAKNGRALASKSESLTFGPTNGTHVMATAPVAPPTVNEGSSVQVSYDLTGVRFVSKPRLVVSSINHWSPFSAPLYRVGYSVPLSQRSGQVTIPASAFAAGGGIYGLAILQDSIHGFFGTVASIRVVGSSAADRPDAPQMGAPGGPLGHTVTVTRAAPRFQVAWNAATVPRATGAELEISAPGPTLFGVLNTFTNQNGSQRDDNGVDTGSVATIPLPRVSGTTTLDVSALGLSSSLHYTLRVLATRGDTVVGQASPVSSLGYDDGLAPGGSTVTGFDINPSGTSTVSTATVGPNNAPTSSDLYPYSPQTGQYGPPYASDLSGQSIYTVLGDDGQAGHMLAEEVPFSGTMQHILTFDTTKHQLIGDVPIDSSSGYLLKAGRVDAARHRLVMLGWRSNDGTDTLLPFDTTTGTMGTPVVPGNGVATHAFYRYLDIDQSTGQADLVGTGIGDQCFLHPSGYTTVNLDTGVSTPQTTPARCINGIASDQAGHAELPVGVLINSSFIPPGSFEQVNEADGSVGRSITLGAEGALFPAVDPVHDLLVVGFLAPRNYQTDNNATSGVGVFNLRTGQQVAYHSGFNFFTTFSGIPNFNGTILGSRGIQLDPSTRTGWTFSPDGNQIEQFSY